MNAARRRANLRMDQLRRALHRGQGDIYQRMKWESLIRMDREPRPLRPLGTLSAHIRQNIACTKGHETEAYIRGWTRRTLTAIRDHQPVPII